VNESTADAVGVPPDFLARLKKTAGPIPWSPKVVAEFLDSLSDEELLPAVTEIVSAHDQINLSNPCCSSLVKAALHRHPCKDFPRSWSDQDKLVFANLDLATREIVLRREHERDAALRTSQNRISAELKRLRTTQGK
jgi:hypothetical protein